ncbi:DUF2586 family protein [Providencia huaxiensis]|uniref:DUF2586 family protein n=1 Tax=Providencia huaxiensis TaxID=2027290 RepID=UPI003F803432
MKRHAVQKLTVLLPGECKPPQDNDVVIVWKTKNTAEIYITVRTYECPKGITVSILLMLA